jgi:predicted small integral membrane protein
MRFANIDWGSDTVVFFGAMLFVVMLITVAMERHSPRRQSRRKVRRDDRDRAGELID